MESRIRQIDFLKCICILLMVIFHLVYIGEKYPYAKDIVYTFHMPIFLVISGYLSHAQKSGRRFWKAQWWIFVPYLLLELPYTVLSGCLGVRGGDTDLSPLHLASRVFLHPLGPYWYLHTLLICNATWWGVLHGLQRANWLLRLGIFAALLGVWAYGTGIVADNVFYYFLGVALSQAGIPFLRAFHPSLTALLPGVLLCCYPGNLHYNVPGGLAITYLTVNFLLWCYDHCSYARHAVTLFIGRNTLPILLFSPIFTLLAKPLVPILSFDPSGMLFLLSATTMAIAGSLAIAWSMDRLHLSRWFCGRTEFLAH